MELARTMLTLDSVPPCVARLAAWFGRSGYGALFGVALSGGMFPSSVSVVSRTYGSRGACVLRLVASGRCMGEFSWGCDIALSQDIIRIC